jgi:hypothetical protein
MENELNDELSPLAKRILTDLTFVLCVLVFFL